MTLIKRIWLLRGDVQTAIVEKNEQMFAQILTALQSHSFEFEVMCSKFATNYIDIVKNDYTNVEDRANYIKKLVNNVNNLKAYRFGDKTVDFDFGGQDCPMHSLWVMRANFEKLKHKCLKYSNNVRENCELFNEVYETGKNMLKAIRCYGNTDEELALMNILDEVRSYYDNYSSNWGRTLPKR